MRVVKLGLISFILLTIVVTGISLLFPSHIRISRAINIMTVPDSVWHKVDDLRTWQLWNPFFNGFETKKVEYLDTAGGTWNALKVATTTVRWKEKNSIEHIAEMQNGTRQPVTCAWKCIEYKQTDKYGIRDSITVQWYMDFKLKWYPWEKLGSLMFEKQYGEVMEKGLANLKKILEK